MSLKIFSLGLLGAIVLACGPAASSVIPVIEPEGGQVAAVTPAPEAGTRPTSVSSSAPVARAARPVQAHRNVTRERVAQRPLPKRQPASRPAAAPQVSPKPAVVRITPDPGPAAEDAAPPAPEQLAPAPTVSPEPARADKATATGTGRVKAVVLPAAGFLLRLGFVLALVWVSLFVLKTFWRGGAGPLKLRGRQLVVEETTSLGPQAAVHLIRIAGQRYLVGTAQGNVSLLTPLEAGVEEPEATTKPDVREPAAQVGLAAMFAGRHEESPKRSAAPGQQVAHDMRSSARFIDELRSRMQTRA